MNIQIYNLLIEQTYLLDDIIWEYEEFFTKLKIILKNVDDLEQFKKIIYEKFNQNIKTDLEFITETNYMNYLKLYTDLILNLLSKQITFQLNNNDLIKLPTNTYKLIITNFTNKIVRIM